MSNLTEITMMDFRSHPGEIMDRMRYCHERFVLTRNGKKVAYLFPIESLYKKPTVQELNQLLKDESQKDITVLPDGSITTITVCP